MAWIFQGNPKSFDIDDYLARYPELIYWRAPRYQREIAVGDLALIWRMVSEAIGRHCSADSAVDVQVLKVDKVRPYVHEFYRSREPCLKAPPFAADTVVPVKRQTSQLC